jgi:hypothetical protein
LAASLAGMRTGLDVPIVHEKQLEPRTPWWRVPAVVGGDNLPVIFMAIRIIAGWLASSISILVSISIRHG